VSTEPITHIRRADRSEELRLLLHRLDLAGQYQRAARARQLGLQQAELTALEHLVVVGGLTPGELGRRLGLTSGGVTALAGRLIEGGHVVRRAHPRDRRMRVLTATAAGRRHLEAYAAPLVAPAERALQWLSSEDEEILKRLLDLLVPLKEHAAASTPGPSTERAAEPYRSAMLM
jgi:DNA-binding MarR family transcriptional regulator